MKKSFLTSLCALCTLFLIPSAVKATDYTIGDNQTTSNNNFIPFSIGSGFNDSFTQQLYLASELTAKGASAGNITALTFKYVGAISSTLSEATRSSVEVWIRAVAISSFPSNSNYGYGPSYSDKTAGTKYFDGSVTLPTTANTTYTITLDEAFAWNGTSNIIITINDKTNSQTNGWARNHLVYSATDRGCYAAANSAAHDASNAYYVEVTKISYVPVITFTFEDSETPIPAPTSPSVDNETTSSADIHWTAAEGADSYSIRYRTSTGAYGDAIEIPGGGSVTSYTLFELEDGVTYYYQIRTNVGSDYSEWTDEDSFSTIAILHEHDDISFSKWAANNSLPTSGAYYLRNNVGLSASVTLEGNLQLCLHGKTLYTSTYHIIVPDGKTLTIFNDTGDGLINGGFEESLGHGGIIEVQDGGTLIISEGTVRNVAENDSYAIYNNGTLQLSGSPTIIGNDASIYLGSSKIITIDGALSNSTPYSVQKALTGDFTSGWTTNMGGGSPSSHFASANASYGICLGSSGEARMVKALTWSESDTNSSIGDNSGQQVNVSLTRSLTSAQYNTFCLPFALTNAQMAEFFGAGYDLEELTSSSLEEEILTLTFERKYALEAGKPYLLQPSIEVVNPSFEGVTITANMPDTIETTFADLRAIYRPTELAGDNHNLLFLGEDNTLFWPENTGNMNAFRAYFVVKGAAANAVQARIGRAESQTTAIENQKSHIDNHKYMKDGQLLIERNGVIYNAQGQTIK